MRLLLSCPFGLTSVLNQELKYLKYYPYDSFDTGTFLDVENFSDIIRLHLRSRIPSKISVQIGEAASCTTFEELFEKTKQLPLEERLPSTEFITIQAHTHESVLHAPRSIQSIVHKAVLEKLLAQKTAPAVRLEDPFEISCLIAGNQTRWFLNLSGAGLHQRGYRTEAGEAPLKENLAAALVLMSGRRWQDMLRDPCCGSGTICIEAAMIARNIAPGLLRDFAFQGMIPYDDEQFQSQKTEAASRAYTKTYQIIGSDMDPFLLEKAQRNAERAGVADTIQWQEYNLMSSHPLPVPKTTEQHIHMITNPPYGKRLKPEELKDLYRTLVKRSQPATHHSTFITSYPELSNLLSTQRPRRTVYNGPDECFVRQKP